MDEDTTHEIEQSLIISVNESINEITIIGDKGVQALKNNQLKLNYKGKLVAYLKYSKASQGDSLIRIESLDQLIVEMLGIKLDSQDIDMEMLLEDYLRLSRQAPIPEARIVGQFLTGVLAGTITTSDHDLFDPELKINDHREPSSTTAQVVFEPPIVMDMPPVIEQATQANHYRLESEITIEEADFLGADDELSLNTALLSKKELDAVVAKVDVESATLEESSILSEYKTRLTTAISDETLSQQLTSSHDQLEDQITEIGRRPLWKLVEEADFEALKENLQGKISKAQEQKNKLEIEINQILMDSQEDATLYYTQIRAGLMPELTISTLEKAVATYAYEDTIFLPDVLLRKLRDDGIIPKVIHLMQAKRYIGHGQFVLDKLQRLEPSSSPEVIRDFVEAASQTQV